MRALLAKPDFVVMPAVWDGLSAKMAAAAGFDTAFLSGSCVAASRLGGPDLDLISFARALTAAGKPCLPREEARMKIRAAVEAAKESGILILARTDCRPTAGIDEAVTRIEMFVEEGADILFLDSPADNAEIHRAITAAKGRSSFVVLSPGGARATPTQAEAKALGFKIGTFPTGMLSPAAAGMKAGLAALQAGLSEAASAMPSVELRDTLGYGDYDAKAKAFITA